MNTNLVNIAGMYKTNNDIVNKAIVDISGEDWFRAPGDDSNHLMWVIGHIIWSRANALKSLNDELTIPWATFFERGAARADREHYPAIEELRNSWQEVSERLMDTLSNAPADLLAEAAPKGTPSFDGKISGLVAFLGFHETYHVGQITYLRKWLGYGQSVG